MSFGDRRKRQIKLGVSDRVSAFRYRNVSSFCSHTVWELQHARQQALGCGDNTGSGPLSHMAGLASFLLHLGRPYALCVVTSGAVLAATNTDTDGQVTDRW